MSDLPFLVSAKRLKEFEKTITRGNPAQPVAKTEPPKKPPPPKPRKCIQILHTCPCGKEFLGLSIRVYCSYECRLEASKRKKENK